MALSLSKVQSRKLDNVVIVSRHDDSIDFDETDWDEYTEDYDLNKIKYVEGKEPTKFICNFKFNAEEAAEIKNSMMSSINKNTKLPNISVGSFQQMVVRFGLKEVQNPESMAEADKIKIKKEGRYVRKDSMALLEEMGLVDEIFSAYNTLISKDVTRGNEKNS